MAKTTSPLFGVDAAGQLGDSLVYSSWKGVKYARRYVIPSNPRTVAQMEVRNTFSFLTQLWNAAPSLLKEPWGAYAKGQALTDRNGFIKFNVPQLRGASNLDGFVSSPGVSGGFSLFSLTATGGSGTITATATVPSLPSGWAVDFVAFVVIKDQDPHTDWAGIMQAESVASAPYQATFSGLPSGRYQVTAYARYMRPDGKVAYSPSLITQANVL